MTDQLQQGTPAHSPVNTGAIDHTKFGARVVGVESDLLVATIYDTFTPYRHTSIAAAHCVHWLFAGTVTGQQLRKFVWPQHPHRLLNLLVVAAVVRVSLLLRLAPVLLDEGAEPPDEACALSYRGHSSESPLSDA